MNRIISEAVRISRDFEGAALVGAVAVMPHAREQRQSMDIDFVVIKQITDAEFLEKGHTIDTLKNRKFTPGGFKIDVHHERESNCIPLEHIVETAAAISADKSGTAVKTISLEGLIVSKFRAGRDADVEDLQRLAVRCKSKINWNEVEHLAKSDTEYSLIRTAIKLYENM